MSEFKRILVTLDGSLLAEQALQPAVILVQATGAELTLLRVITPIYLWAPFIEIEPDFEVAQIRSEEKGASYLEEIKERLLGQDSSLQIQTVILHGPVAESIIDHSIEIKADLIVMSSHGRSGLSRWVYGSIAEKVLRGAHCSTLIVRGEYLQRAADD